MINFQNVEFDKSVADVTQLPPDQGGEVAFIGRSNCGKSRSLNALTNSKRLAKVSKRPGHTQLLNFFNLSHQYRLVDLPGYGYAKVPRQQQKQWQQLINAYLHQRQSLRGLVLLMDIRHPLQPLDQQMIDWCLDNHIPLHILLSKADKLRYGAAMNQLQQVKKALSLYPQTISLQLFSALNRRGVDELKKQLANWLKN
ncbi:MAG: YihA family ribosome biogenesis GTP-binding protein [Gammaproteobacteria bacterium]|nr:YihA family ribosome biogenesis GTP-binding protein [Gammaproteobacteria bacterium]